MSKGDKRLGMDRPITRRDFLHDTSAAALGLSLGITTAGAAAGDPAAGDPAAGGPAAGDPAAGGIGADYPPTKTGLRGSHPGSFEAAHALAREGKTFPPPRDLDEEYDLVVVGAGISGLAAAQFYRRRFGADARILILENHDDFGGHARRNEFHQGGEMRLSLGGTHNLEHWDFSATVNDLLEEMGVDIQDMRQNMEFQYGYNSRRGPATWFDAQTYGENKLVTGWSIANRGRGNPAPAIAQAPLSAAARAQLTRLYTGRDNVLPDLSEAEVEAYLSTISYPEFLRRHAGLGDEAVQLFDKVPHGSWGVEMRALSATEGLWEGMPGLNLLGHEGETGGWDYPVAMFPDGNASVARLQVAELIPAVAPGTNANNVAVARFEYGKLDKPDAPVRLRLSSTVIHTENDGDATRVTYLRDGVPVRVRSRHCVLACYHVLIPHLCPDLPERQVEALKYQVKIPLLLTNVLIRSSAPMDKLGIDAVQCPGRMHASMFMFKGINTGGYTHGYQDGGPVPLVFWGSISPPAGTVTLKDQLRASRSIMLGLEFEDYEREVRSVCEGLLGPAGFDVREDILAITVNRWPHGYAYEYMDLWDPDWPAGQAPHEIARRPVGNIAIANADAGASAYTHVAIDQAHRAVSELS